MKKDTELSELRAIIRDILKEDMAGFNTGMSPQTHAMLNNPVSTGKSKPPPLPPGAQKQASSAALPQKGALNKFKADVNMAIDAASKTQAAIEAANTKEALRWLDKLIGFATSAKGSLGVK